LAGGQAGPTLIDDLYELERDFFFIPGELAQHVRFWRIPFRDRLSNDVERADFGKLPEDGKFTSSLTVVHKFQPGRREASAAALLYRQRRRLHAMVRPRSLLCRSLCLPEKPVEVAPRKIATLQDDSGNLSRVPNIVERIGIEKKQVR